MNYNEALNFISSLKTVSLKPSLERIKALLFALGNPQEETKAIHIAGTNGKGSVASMVSSVLQKAGYKVGLFTSPYVLCFRERIRISGEMISEETLAELCGFVKKAYEGIKFEVPELSQFEFITAVAFLYFKSQKCDYVVLETGLGGRFDATNVIEKPVCSLITSISLDHTKVLGENISQIAFEKAGIIKKNVPVFSVDSGAEAIQIITNEAQKQNSQLFVSSLNKIESVVSDMEKTSFVLDGFEFKTNLLGKFQIENALLAVCMLKETFPKMDNETINAGLSQVSHIGRMEIVSENPKIILDGAHNPDAAKKLSQFLIENKWAGTIIFSAMSDKKYDEVLKYLSKATDKIILVALDNLPRAASCEEMLEIASKNFKVLEIAESIDEALMLGGESILACGSLYLVSEIREKIVK